MKQPSVDAAAQSGDAPSQQAGGTRYDPLQVNLPYFDGPLDLLLHLVRKQALDINELRLSELTEPYLAYVERMQELNLDRAGEFLAIAATLIWLKSRSLLPRERLHEDEPDPETVEELLLLRLQEYQRVKEAAGQLMEREVLGRDVFPRAASADDARPDAPGPVFEEVSLFGLIEAFRGVLERSATLSELHIIPERSKVEDRIDQVLTLLGARRALYFHEFFGQDAGRAEVVLTFIAVLELVRLRAVRISQARPLGPLYCEATEAFTEGGADYRAMILDGLFGGARAKAGEDDPPPDAEAQAT